MNVTSAPGCGAVLPCSATIRKWKMVRASSPMSVCATVTGAVPAGTVAGIVCDPYAVEVPYWK